MPKLRGPKTRGAAARPARRAKITKPKNSLSRSAAQRRVAEHDAPPSISDSPRWNRSARNLYDLLGGRDGVLDLLHDVAPPDLTNDNSTDSTASKLAELRKILMNDDFAGQRADGHPKMTFGMMLSTAKLSARDVYQLFLDRRRAETVVTLADAEPRLAGELVQRASQKYVPCRSCGGTKKLFVETEDGDSAVADCFACDANGKQLIDGDFDAMELFFDITQLSRGKGGIGVTVNANQTVEQHQNNFVVGMPGTAPSALNMIRAMDRIVDAGARPMLPAVPDQNSEIPAREAELVER